MSSSTRNPLSWFEIYVTDMDRAIQFYQAVTGLTLSKLDVGDFDGQMYGFPMNMGVEGASGALVKWDQQQPSSSGTIIYFDSKDCNIELSRVVEAGGQILQPKMQAGGFGYSCLIRDTEGNTFGFYSNN